ncbi:MAG: hypothetical protein ACYTFA_14045 [Planctomycetota bacterium]|jgi:hypothetical protein
MRNTAFDNSAFETARASVRSTVLASVILTVLAVGFAKPVQADEETLTGRLSVLWVDPDPESGQAPWQRALLGDDQGNLIVLDLPPDVVESVGGVPALEGESATVHGDFPTGPAGRFVVSRLELDQPVGGLRHPVPTSGPQPQVTILLRYADVSYTPEPLSYFEGLMLSSEFPGLNHCLKEISYNSINVNGSQVVNWLDLPNPWSHYNWDIDNNGWPEFDLDRALDDALPLADPHVTYPNFRSINLMFNDEPGCNGPGILCAAATGATLDLDGQTKNYGLTFFGPWGYHLQAVVPHETMHTYGVHHSGGQYGEAYDSHWDVASGSGTCDPPHPVYGCLAVYTIAWAMLELGWMPAHRCYNTGASGAGTITIERLAFPPLAGGTYGMAKVWALGLPDFFYTVEYRTLDGWDGAGPIPGEAVVLHRVETGLVDRQAQVIDYDWDGDPNDEGAMWLPGETYLNTTTKVVIHVEEVNGTDAMVSVSNKAREEVYAYWGASGYQDGSTADPWNTIEESYASVHPGGTVYAFPGNYNERLRMSKPCRIVPSYGDQPVIIGE